MARVNVTIPDELINRARSAGLNVSRLAASALAEELDRRAKVAELDRYLHELETEMGSMSAAEHAAAREWADAAFGPVATPASDRSTRTA